MLKKFLNSKKINRALSFMLVFTLTFANYMLIGMHLCESSISYAKEEKEVNLELEQVFETNKVYEFEEGFKRIVQLRITSKIENAEGEAGILLPETLIENAEPEEIKAISYNTDFSLEDNELKFETKETSEFIVTYIYNEEVTYNDEEEKYEVNEEPELKSEEIFVNVDVKDDEKISAKAEKIEYTLGFQFGDIVSLNEEFEQIYKGNMYLGENTQYSKIVTVEMKDLEKELLKENFVINSSEEILQEEINAETEETIETKIENATYYKSTSFNKKELLNLFGSESNIVITAKSNEAEKNTIILFAEYDEEKEEYKEYDLIDITKMDEEDEEIIIEHTAEVVDVEVKTTIPEKEGILNIKHNKEIKLDENSNIEKINKLNSKISLEFGEDSKFNVDFEKEHSIEEPITEAIVNMEYMNANQTVLSSLIDNEVNFAINLLANGPKYKLYKNPVIKITLPSAISVVSIKDVALALNDGLELKNSAIVNNTIVIELSGEQNEYNYDEMQQTISLGAVLKVERTTPTGEFEITSTCKNGEEEEISLESTKVNVFSPAELISLTNITVNNQVTTSIEENNTIKISTFAENTVANIDVSLINNHGNPVKDLKIKGNLDSTFDSNLLEGIKLSGLNGEIEYFNGETKVEDIAIATEYIISIEEMKQAEQLNISYALTIAENLPYNETLNSNLIMEYVYNDNICEKELNMQITTGKGPSAKIELIPEIENDVLNGGQIATYNIKVINDGDENIPEAIFTYEILENAKIIEFTTLQGSIFEYEEDDDNKKEWSIKDLAVGEEVEAQIVIKADDITESKELLSKASLVTGETTIAIEETNIEIVPADFEIKMTTYTNNQGTFDEGDILKYRISVKNISGEDITNAMIATTIPEHTKFIKGYFYDENTDNIEEKNYKKENSTVSYNIEKIANNETIVAVLEVELEKLPEEMNNEAKIRNYAVVEAKGKAECQSNIIEHTMHTADFEIHLNSENPVTLEVYDNIEYNITVTNTGKRNAAPKIEDCVPDVVSVNEISYYVSEDNINTKYVLGSDVEVIYPLAVGETLNVKIEGVVRDLDDSEETKTINNVAKLNLGNGSYKESEVVTNIIKNDSKQQLKEDNNSSENNGNTPNTEKEDKDIKTDTEKHNILGVAWLDENEDGKKESTEKLLEGIEVLLVDASTGNVIENSNKEKLVTKTSKNGEYTFEGLENGNYKVLFKYDNSKYHTTTYKKEGINESVNSDANSQTVTLNGENKIVGLTDTITIKNSSVVNIDLGIVENDTFDLSLKKQIKKVTVKNNSGTTEYDFTNTDFAKVEIPGKNYKGSTLLIEYEIIVANEGDITAYVTDIIDYMPKDLTFNSEMNTNWYVDSEGILHDIALSMDGLEPGKQFAEKLILTKTISSDESLTIENLAEIGSATNTEGLEEKDSTPANKKAGEDDFGKAELIVSIKTGGTWMYIGITLLSLTIITLGIFLINKKVLKGNI